MSIPFDNTYARLPDRFFASQKPSSAPNPALLRLNHDLATRLDLDSDWLESEDGVSVLSGNAVAEGSEPIAQAYAGHQFGHFVPQLGDGRAILLGEVVARDGQRFDLQLKGSGRTPFSRNGDGKSALGPVIREYIVSEAMAALGVPTTRALAAVATGETVWRQEGEVPGGVFTRVAASHIRVGTFQFFHARDDRDALRELADYVIARHYPKSAAAEQPYLSLLESVVHAHADLVAQWMSLGFIHGVMNTDNSAISGETIDYGPCAFMEAFHPNCVFSSIDSRARYAWGNQGNIALWNLTRFAETLIPLLGENSEHSIEKLEATLSLFSDRFAKQYAIRFQSKLGLPSDAPAALTSGCLELLATQEVDFTLFFRTLTQVANGGSAEKLAKLFADRTPFEAWFALWQKETSSRSRFEEMKGANPIIIPRNHRVEQAIQAAYANDCAPFHRLVEAMRNPYEEQAGYANYERLPRPEEVVRQTFCGT